MKTQELNIIKLYNEDMETFHVKPKKWGNSLGVIIPKEIVEREKISTKKEIVVHISGIDPMDGIRKIFGTAKFKKSTQQIMDEIDEGYDEHTFR